MDDINADLIYRIYINLCALSNSVSIYVNLDKSKEDISDKVLTIFNLSSY